jgi:hypothetical protein
MLLPLGLAALLLCAACGGSDRVSSRAQRQAAPPTQQEPELTPKDAARIPPFPPTNIKMMTGPKGPTITWDKSPLENVVTYRIYRRVHGSRWQRIGETPMTTFTDTAAQGESLYSVAAVNVYGAESPLPRDDEGRERK